MGLLRFLLAISVAIDHFGGIGGFRMGPGSIEVEAFFIVSGFYMAMVLERKYAGRIREFYRNRYLRILPSYLAVAALTLICAATFGTHSKFAMPIENVYAHFLSADFFAKIYFIIANFGIFLIDASLFLSFDGQSLHFAGDFRESGVLVYEMLLVPQGWSLGCELYFYALAPVIVVSSWRLALAFIASVCVFVTLQSTSLPADPWTHRFFPSILFMFLAGSAAWRVVRAHLDHPKVCAAGRLLLPICGIAIAGLGFSNLHAELERAIFLILTVVSVGPIFALTRKSRIDNSLGEYSYPIYVSHLLAFSLASAAMPAAIARYAALAVTLALSAALVYLIERPFEKLRNARLARNFEGRTEGPMTANPGGLSA